MIAYLEMPEAWILSSVVANVPVFILCPVKFSETHYGILWHHRKFVSNTFSLSVPTFLFDHMTVNLHAVTCKYSLLVRYRVFLLLFPQAHQLSDIESLPLPAVHNDICYAEGNNKTDTMYLTHWGRVTQLCVFNTRLFSLQNTLNL